MNFRKHWKHFLLSSAAFFWAGCGGDSESIAPENEDIHSTQTVHDAAYPRRAGFQQVIVGLGMFQIGLTGIIDHLLFVLETRLPHSLLQLSVLKGILTV